MSPDEERIASSIERVVNERLTDGLSAIQDQATGLMREVAGEVWRASGTDASSGAGTNRLAPVARPNDPEPVGIQR